MAKFICKGSTKNKNFMMPCVPCELIINANVDIPDDCPYGISDPEWEKEIAPANNKEAQGQHTTGKGRK